MWHFFHRNAEWTRHRSAMSAMYFQTYECHLTTEEKIGHLHCRTREPYFTVAHEKALISSICSTKSNSVNHIEPQNSYELKETLVSLPCTASICEFDVCISFSGYLYCGQNLQYSSCSVILLPLWTFLKDPLFYPHNSAWLLNVLFKNALRLYQKERELSQILLFGCLVMNFSCSSAK